MAQTLALTLTLAVFLAKNYIKKTIHAPYSCYRYDLTQYKLSMVKTKPGLYLPFKVISYTQIILLRLQ